MGVARPDDFLGVTVIVAELAAVGGVVIIPSASVENYFGDSIILGNGEGQRAAIDAELRAVAGAPETVFRGDTLVLRRDGEGDVGGSKRQFCGDIACCGVCARCGHVHAVEVKDGLVAGLFNLIPLDLGLVALLAAVVDALYSDTVVVAEVIIQEYDFVTFAGLEVPIICEGIGDFGEILCQFLTDVGRECDLRNLTCDISIKSVEELVLFQVVAVSIGSGNTHKYRTITIFSVVGTHFYNLRIGRRGCDIRNVGIG